MDPAEPAGSGTTHFENNLQLIACVLAIDLSGYISAELQSYHPRHSKSGKLRAPTTEIDG
jgi:hypothetical protein